MSYNKKVRIIAAALVVCSGLSYADSVKLNIVNNSGREISVDLIKTDVSSLAYNFKTNTCKTKFIKDANNSNILDLPIGARTQILIDSSCLENGARLYVAQGSPANNFNTGMSGVPGVPDLNSYPNVYDAINVGWQNNALASWNVNAVDFFGIALQLSDGTKLIGFNNGETRQDIIQKLTTVYSKYPHIYDSKFFVKNSTTQQVLRIFSPQHFWPTMGTSWDKAIDTDLNTLAQNKNFKFQYAGFTYTNLTKNANNALSATCSAPGAQAVCSLTNINTTNSIGGQIAYAPKSGLAGAMAANFAGMIAAVINRGVLAHPEYWGSNGSVNFGDGYYPYWYNNINMAYNIYGKALTSSALNNKINDASYEDYWNMDNSLYIGSKNNNVNLIILPFGNSY